MKGLPPFVVYMKKCRKREFFLWIYDLVCVDGGIDQWIWEWTDKKYWASRIWTKYFLFFWRNLLAKDANIDCMLLYMNLDSVIMPSNKCLSTGKDFSH